MVDSLRSDSAAPDGRSAGLFWIMLAAAAVIAVAGLAGRFGSPVPAHAAPAPHVVVLPCRLLEGTEVDRTYCEGLADTLTAQLSQLSARERLQVTPSSIVRSTGVTTAAAARRELGAGLAFEGTVFVVGRERRVNYALVDTSTASQLDATTFTAPIGDGFASADRVVEWALQALEARLARRLEARPQRATTLAQAEDFFIQGRGYLLEFQRPEKVDVAITLFERALELDPAHIPARAGLGTAYWLKYESTREAVWVDRAREACTKAAAGTPPSAAAHVCLGTLNMGTGQYEQALQAFRRAVDADPAMDDGYLGLARAQEQLGRFEEAEKTFLQGIARRPWYWAGRLWLGRFYSGRGRYGEAIEQYEQATALSPDNIRVYATLASACALSGRYEQAIEACQRSIQISPNAAAYGNWGMTAYRQRRFEEAIRRLEMAQALGPDFRMLGNLARACYWGGQRERARRLYEEALAAGRRELEVNPRNHNVQLSVAEFLAKLGRGQEAREILRNVPMLGPHERHYAAMTLAQAGDDERALALLREAVAQGLPANQLEAFIDLDRLRRHPQFIALIAQRRH